MRFVGVTDRPFTVVDVCYCKDHKVELLPCVPHVTRYASVLIRIPTNQSCSWTAFLENFSHVNF